MALLVLPSDFANKVYVDPDHIKGFSEVYHTEQPKEFWRHVVLGKDVPLYFNVNIHIGDELNTLTYFNITDAREIVAILKDAKL